MYRRRRRRRPPARVSGHDSSATENRCSRSIRTTSCLLGAPLTRRDRTLTSKVASVRKRRSDRGRSGATRPGRTFWDDAEHSVRTSEWNTRRLANFYEGREARQLYGASILETEMEKFECVTLFSDRPGVDIRVYRYHRKDGDEEMALSPSLENDQLARTTEGMMYAHLPHLAQQQLAKGRSAFVRGRFEVED
jgi:hypothetical protein